MEVALLSGLDSEGQKKLNSTKDSDHHLNKLLRLLTVRTEAGRERSGIALVGGPHDPKADGSATQRCCTFSVLLLLVDCIALDCSRRVFISKFKGCCWFWVHSCLTS